MALSGRTAVITGGAGLIGSFLAERLVGAGAKVIVADDFSKGRKEHLSSILDRIEVRPCDLETAAGMERALAGAELVFHLASRTYGIGYSAKHHLTILQHNERITNNLMEQLARKPAAQLLLASSSSVYPDDGPAIIPELPLFTGEPEEAHRGHGWANRFMEQKALILAEQTGIPVTIVRPFNVYGERYAWVGENSQAIPMLVKKVMDGNDPVMIWGSGEQRRNYMHAIDCANVMAMLVEREAVGTVNIGTEETVTLREVVELICQLSGRRPTISLDLSKPQGRAAKSASSRLLRAGLPDFKVSIRLDEGLRRMLGWYRTTFAEGVTRPRP